MKDKIRKKRKDAGKKRGPYKKRQAKGTWKKTEPKTVDAKDVFKVKELKGGSVVMVKKAACETLDSNVRVGVCEKQKPVKIKKRFGNTLVGSFLTKLGAGVLSEGASLIPVVGHKLASKVDKATEAVTQERENSSPKYLGHIVTVVFLLVFLYGRITHKDLFSQDELFGLLKGIRNLFGF